MNNINNGLKQARLNKNLSITELATLIHKDSTTISMWESGLRTIDPPSLLRLSNILECTTEMILFGESREELRLDKLTLEQQKAVYNPTWVWAWLCDTDRSCGIFV